jgi:signal transduction histidine kinase
LKRSDFESQRRLRGAINAISHDLKNPAMGISVILQGLLIQPDRVLSIDRQILEQLLASSNRQIDLIKSILTAQSAAGNAFLLANLQPWQLRDILAEVLTDLAPIASQNRMQIIDRIEQNLPLIYADKIQLGRVFNNLIANAIEYNPPGTQIEIGAEVTRDRRGQWLRCTIRDNGVGIPPPQRPYLFDLYARGNNARRMPGLGLGLYLCRQIIIAHRGEIGFNGPVDGGSEFWFTIPMMTD